MKLNGPAGLDAIWMPGSQRARTTVMNHSYTIGNGNIDIAFESENTTLFKGNREAAGVHEHVVTKSETVAMN
jgi:phage gp45-like